jgi:hypothetical protein
VRTLDFTSLASAHNSYQTGLTFIATLTRVVE